MRHRRNRKAASHDLFVLLHSTRVDQRRRRGRLAARILMGAVVLALLMGGIAVGVMQAGRRLLIESPYFRIRELDLHSDGRLRPRHIREYTGLREGMGIFEVDFDSVARALHSVPLVADVKIVRHLPDRLEVAVTERVPLARLRGRRSRVYYAVDSEGCVLGPTYGSSALPVIEWDRSERLSPGQVVRDPRVRDALYVLDLLRRRGDLDEIRPRRIRVRDPETLDLELASGTRVLLRRVAIEQRLRKVSAILQTCRLHRRECPTFIDATVDGDYPARFR